MMRYTSRSREKPLMQFQNCPCPRCRDALYFSRYLYSGSEMVMELRCHGCHYAGVYSMVGEAVEEKKCKFRK